MKIFVTGASGFVGRALVREMRNRSGFEVCESVRTASRESGAVEKNVFVGDLASDANWTAALTGVDIVVHAAARVHVMRDRATEPLAEFRAVNVNGTLALARHAAAAGVKRFVFISSVKVNGEATLRGKPFTETDAPDPQDDYGVSKLEAEQGLHKLAVKGGMEIVIIRPPLVYGPGVRANFLTLIRAVEIGLPLPLAAVDNRRSLIGLDNLVDFIIGCCSHPAAANETFLVSDGDDISTPDLIRGLALAVGKPSRLFPLPIWMLKAGALLLGKRGEFERVCGNLQVDSSKARNVMGWGPPLTVQAGLSQVVLQDGT